jgi:extracellular elastinolytic metalloproteinase
MGKTSRHLSPCLGASFVCSAIVLSSFTFVSPIRAEETLQERVPVGRIAGDATVPANYNARFDEAFHAEFGKTGRSGKRTAISSGEAAAEKALANRIPQLHIERDQFSQLPVMVLSYEPGRRLSRPVGKSEESAESAARTFLLANRNLFALSGSDVESLKLRYVTSPEGGATIAKFDQYADGLPVFDAEFAVTMSKRNEVVATAGRIYPGTSEARKAGENFVLPVEQAISVALADLTSKTTLAGDFTLVNNKAEGDYQVYEYSPDRLAGARRFLSEKVRTKRYLFPLGAAQFEPAYYLELWIDGEPSGSGPVFSYVISAADGRLLFRNNLTQSESYTYRVYADGAPSYRPWDGPTGTIGTPHPTGTPDGFQAPFVPAQDRAIESLLGPSDPWLGPGATVTTGNNTEAYLDIAGPDGFNGTDVRGATNGTNQFVYDYDHTQPTSNATNRQSAVVNMFYQVNWQHDVWYQRGFTEAAGNAQADNYGRGGAQNDSVKSEGQDSSGTDNANMSTPSDGGRPRMQMYRFRAGGRLTPDRDGTFDMLIVGHELMHYMSNRLVGNANGLSNNQGRSMGEGWADFNCDLLTTQDTDDLDGTYAVGGYTDLFWCGNSMVDNYYYSIRRYPYTSRKDKNPLTFKDIGPGITTYPGVSGNPCTSLTGSPAEVHNSGEIWCNMLWECFVGLGKAYGLPAGRDKVLQYTIDGLKGTPSQPTFTQARNAVIAAANAANPIANPRDQQILWQAFAKRGIGTNAVSPASNSGNHAGVVEDFTASPALPDDTFGLWLNGSYFLQNIAFGGIANLSFGFGTSSLRPLFGNWDGGTGVSGADTVGAYDPTTAAFFLKNSNGSGNADILFNYGAANAGLIPVVGDWNGDGVTTIGVYNPTSGFFFLRNANSPGPADIVVGFGPGGANFVPVVGDWNNDGVDTIGVFDRNTGAFFLRDSNTPGVADYTFAFGSGGASIVPLAGDWNSDGLDTIAIYNPATGAYFFKNTLTSGPADDTIVFGPTGSGIAVAGNFDGQ